MEVRCAGIHARPSGESLQIPTALPAQDQGACPRRVGLGQASGTLTARKAKRHVTGTKGLPVQGLIPSMVATGAGTSSGRDSFSDVGYGELTWVPRTT